MGCFVASIVSQMEHLLAANVARQSRQLDPVLRKLRAFPVVVVHVPLPRSVLQTLSALIDDVIVSIHGFLRTTQWRVSSQKLFPTDDEQEDPLDPGGGVEWKSHKKDKVLVLRQS